MNKQRGNKLLVYLVNTVRIQVAVDILRKSSTGDLYVKVKSVDSEFWRNAVTDDRVHFQLLTSMADPEHPLHKNSCGSKNSLQAACAQDTRKMRDMMKAHWTRSFNGANMGAVIIGRESTDTLQAWLEEEFDQVCFMTIARGACFTHVCGRLAPRLRFLCTCVLGISHRTLPVVTQHPYR